MGDPACMSVEAVIHRKNVEGVFVTSRLKPSVGVLGVGSAMELIGVRSTC